MLTFSSQNFQTLIYKYRTIFIKTRGTFGPKSLTCVYIYLSKEATIKPSGTIYNNSRENAIDIFSKLDNVTYQIPKV